MNKYLKPEIKIMELVMVDVIETSGKKPGLNPEGEGNNKNPMEWTSLWDNAN